MQGGRPHSTQRYERFPLGLLLLASASAAPEHGAWCLWLEGGEGVCGRCENVAAGGGVNNIGCLNICGKVMRQLWGNWGFVGACGGL